MQGRQGHGRMEMHGPMMSDGQRPGIVGTVTAIQGSTITLESRSKGTATTTYSVDASTATIDRQGTGATIADIIKGDMLMIRGTVTGSSVKATMIHDGRMPRGGMRGEKRGWDSASSTQGMLVGTVSAPHGDRRPAQGGIGNLFRHLFGF